VVLVPLILYMAAVYIPLGGSYALIGLVASIFAFLMKLLMIPAKLSVALCFPGLSNYLMGIGESLFNTRLGKKILFLKPLMKNRGKPQVFAASSDFSVPGVEVLMLPVQWYFPCSASYCFLVGQHFLCFGKG
jgi:hypothetical protein